MSELYDIAILGAGPAGISAAIYAVRGRLKALWLDNQFVEGGQVLNTYEVDNYPGLPGISGMDLGEAMGNHAEKLGIAPVRGKVLAVENAGSEKIIRTKKHEYQAKTLILAMGVMTAKLLKGEDELLGRGVSYCATCDGMFYKDKEIAVLCNDPKYEHEVEYLADLVAKVTYFPMFSDSQIKSMLEGKKTLVKGLKGKKGGYDAYLIPEGIEDYSYIKDGKEMKGSQYRFKMEFPKKSSEVKRR